MGFFRPTIDSHPATTPLLVLQTMRELSYEGWKANLAPILAGEGKAMEELQLGCHPRNPTQLVGLGAYLHVPICWDYWGRKASMGRSVLSFD
jgi:hypothetical protein